MADTVPCSVCGAPAIAWLTQLGNFQLKKTPLCFACATAQSMCGEAAFSLGGFFEKFRVLMPPPVVCKTCGLSEIDFEKTRRFGCPDCYETFSEQLAGEIKNQPATHHTGKIPGGKTGAAARLEQIAGAKKQLAGAVKAENFELAARLRDEIRNLENRPAVSGKPLQSIAGDEKQITLNLR